MGFWEVAGKVTGAMAENMAQTARSSAKKDIFSEEQKEWYRNVDEQLSRYSNYINSINNADDDDY